MNALQLVLKPDAQGWAVGLTDGRELARFRGSWFEVARAALPRQRHEGLASPSCRERRFPSNLGWLLAGRRADRVRLGVGSGFVLPTVPHRPRVLRRLAEALVALGFVLPLLAPSRSSASSFVIRREANAGGPQPNQARQDQAPPQPTAAAPSRPDVRPTTDGASVLVLLILTLNSAVMLIRVTNSPPRWMKD
jgi:hypothetical protein